MTAFARNALGGELQACGFDPKTGYLRDGHCRTRDDDVGSHIVCAQMTDAFLEFSRARGNDLVTPVPAFDFPGLRAGDRWCLCARRWQEAHEAGSAPPVFLQATHEKVLRLVPLDELLPYALDLPRNG
ncbi:MAG: DUF2237 domain-containing protein [Gammaproteobacteria bacterium]|nr:DUF2237 domain-containing protein [Gammaproteobacteria bacterium]